MKAYDTSHIRNVVLLAHVGTGKTSLVEAIAHSAGVTSRLGKVEDGSTISDFDPDEAKRHMSINLSVVPVEWKGVKINLLDAPGYSEFVGEMKGGAAAADSAVIVLCGAAGVQVGTEQAWDIAAERGLPRAFFVNRMDRENADFGRTLAQLRDRFGSRVGAVQLPIGAFSSFQGVVDLVSMKAHGEKGQDIPIPAEMEAEITAAREAMIEAAAEGDDELITKFLEGEQLTDEEILRGIHEGFRAGTFFPVYVGAATREIGIDTLLDDIVEFAPNPEEGPAVNVEVGGKSAPLSTGADGLVLRVFKTTADPFVGKLTYFKVLRGSVHANIETWSPNHGKTERIGQIFYVRGKQQEPATDVGPGDIAAVAKLADAMTGDTLATKDAGQVEPIGFPEAAHRAAVSPKTKADLDKLGAALARIAEEDPTLHIYRDPDTGEQIFAGMGETHLDVAAEKMRRKFGVEVDLHPPRIAYKETVTRPASAEFTHKKQTGGHGQYAKVALEVAPLARGGGIEFAERVVGGSVPKQYIPAVEKGVHEQSAEGVVAHFPLVDVKVTLVDGKEHPVDSSEMAFKLASAQALKAALEQAHPVLLEPIVTLQVDVPEEYVGDVVSDLNGKRAKVHGMNPNGGITTVEADVPMAEVQHYSADLRSITHGRGRYHLEFSHYEEVPALQAKKVVEAAQKEREAAKV